MSLYNGGMTLFTQPHGLGKRVRFNQFGDVRIVTYQDLVEFISNQYKFFTEGFCVILNKDAIKAQGLEDFYEKILTVNQIENILTYDTKVIKALLENSPRNVKDTVVEKTVSKMLSGESVDTSKIQAISEVYGRDLFEVVAILKEAKPK